ncbi:MAG: C39 family peptidase [Clostridia bacterium]|nr:C39 family peptidase [Clostridia bacterium]
MNFKFIIKELFLLQILIATNLSLPIRAMDVDNKKKIATELSISSGEIKNSCAPTKLINVPYINQNEIVYGCEAVSSTMLLQYYGYEINEQEFTDKYLIKKDWFVGSDNKPYGPDPYAAYPGDPYKSSGENCGFGSFAPSTAKSIGY